MRCDNSARCFLLIACMIQLVCTVERLVFSCLNFLWALVIADSLQIVFIFICFYGTCRYQAKVVMVYLGWCLVWLGVNIFVLCYVSNIGLLDRRSRWFSFGMADRDWWTMNGPGCRPSNESSALANVTTSLSFEGCLISSYYIDALQAGIQILLALLAFCAACCVAYVYTEEDDFSQPVQDELEYIRMRYKSPARNTFDKRGHDVNALYQPLNRGSSSVGDKRSSMVKDPRHSQQGTDSAAEPFSKYVNVFGAVDDSKDKPVPGMTVVT